MTLLDTVTLDNAQLNVAGEDMAMLLVRNMQVGEQRDIMFQAQIASDAPTNTVLALYAEFPQRRGFDQPVFKTSRPLAVQERTWDTYKRSNYVPVLVGDANITSALVWMNISQGHGSAGTVQHVFSDRFLPNETVSMWLNSQGTVIPLDTYAKVDEQGHVTYQLTTDGYAPGSYELVVQGLTSKLQAVATFEVR
jgi:hypothetical protein